MHQANREAVFAWLDACNRKTKAELLRTGKHKTEKQLMNCSLSEKRERNGNHTWSLRM